MTKIRTFMTVVLPSMLAGGLLFNAAFSDAAAGDNVVGFWPAASDAAAPYRLPPPPPAPPAQPAPPAAPLPPKPPKPPKFKAGGGFSVNVNGGKVQLDGIRDMVTAELDRARAQIVANPSIPKGVRDKVLARLDKARAKVDKRLSKLDFSDLDQLGEEMGKMGEELDEAFSGFGDEIGSEIEKEMAKSMAKSFGKWSVDVDHDDDDDDNDADDDDNHIPLPNVDVDVDVDVDLSDLGDLRLQPAQRAAINNLRVDADRTVKTARKQLDDLSDKLHDKLGDPSASDDEVARLVDQVSAQEAVIRKARIVSWVRARRVLDAQQQKKIQDAAGKKSK